MELQGRKALVFGGASGIGLAAVRRLAEGGARVVALSRNPERAASELPEGVAMESVDVLDREALAETFARHAPIDVLVNAATGGARASGPFLQMDLDAFQGSFRKLWGYTNTVRLGAEHLSEDAAIVLVSGYPARNPGPGALALSTVGNAVEGFVRAVAPELAPRRINVVSPGPDRHAPPARGGRGPCAVLRPGHRQAPHSPHRHRRRSGCGHPVRDRKRLRDRHHGGCGWRGIAVLKAPRCLPGFDGQPGASLRAM